MNNRPTGFQCMQYTAAELIERWGKFHADVTISPLPRHKYTAEVLSRDGFKRTWNFTRLSALLAFTRQAKHTDSSACVLIISKDGDFFTAKGV